MMCFFSMSGCSSALVDELNIVLVLLKVIDLKKVCDFVDANCLELIETSFSTQINHTVSIHPIDETVVSSYACSSIKLHRRPSIGAKHGRG